MAADLLVDEAVPELGIDARQQDAYWSSVFAVQGYCRRGCDYEDYAPAYCVGYVGYAQYGGSLLDARHSLCANWERIKGGSRLTLAEALVAIEAAWRRAEAVAVQPAARHERGHVDCLEGCSTQ